MTKQDLNQLILDAREDDEGVAREFKRQWWDFRVNKSADEFLRDVSAMANATTRDERYIFIGLKTGLLTAAPLPCDEAEIQQRLSRITPPPHVDIYVVEFEGVQVTVLHVRAPFNPPHVAPFENSDRVFVRRGSRIVGATRADFDRWYQAKRALPELLVFFDGYTPQDEELFAEHPFRLSLIRPPFNFDSVKAELAGQLAAAQMLQHRDPTFEGRLQTFEKEVEAYLDEVKDDGNLLACLIHQGKHRSSKFKVRMNNSGTRPAVEAKFQIDDLPGWLYMGTRRDRLRRLHGGRKLPQCPEPREPPPPREPLPPSEVATILQRVRRSGVPDSITSHLAIVGGQYPGLPELNFPRQIPQPILSRPEPPTQALIVDDASLFGWRAQLMHDHSMTFKEELFVAVSPSAPLGVHRFEASLFCEAFDGWRETEFVVEVTEEAAPG